MIVLLSTDHMGVNTVLHVWCDIKKEIPSKEKECAYAVLLVSVSTDTATSLVDVHCSSVT